MNSGSALDLLRRSNQVSSPLFAVSARPDASDERVASGSAVRLLITAATPDLVEAVARRIHTASRGAAPFVQVAARDLPAGTFLLTAALTSLFNRATTGGSLLLADVEEMPATVQDGLFEVIEGLQIARGSPDAVRLMSGTTVSLLERVKAGMFSERLFYRLNLLHVRPAMSSRSAGTSSVQ